MGNKNTTEKPSAIHEDVIRIINANVQQSTHLEKTADATKLLASVRVIILIILIAYGVYKAIITYERMKTETNIQKAVSLANIVVEK